MPIRLPLAARNPLSLAGVAIATSMAVLFLALIGLELFGLLTNPYIGLLLFVAVPAVFVIGLLLIPLGAWWAGRRLRLDPSQPVDWPVLDLRNARQRRVLGGVFVLTVVNLAIVSMAAYGGAHYMESSEFCGNVCHTTMGPQYAAYQNGPHARVECAQCHVGPGAGAFVESKMEGARRLVHVATGAVPAPVPSPERLLRPARDTCEQCHWPERFRGDIVREIREYADDEPSTESVTTLVMHVGGGSTKLGVGRGIHWHMNLDNRVEFITGGEQDVVSYVRMTDRQGRAREYFGPGIAPGARPDGALRSMDCMDCHNRPAHTFQPSPGRAVDVAIAQGRLPRELPFMRREAVAAVSDSYADSAVAEEAIERRLRDFYRGRDVTETLVARAVAGAKDVWAQNVFPAMNVTWGTYRNDIGHVDSPGCFRCHDDEHKSADGRVISQDCELCHAFSGE